MKHLYGAPLPEHPNPENLVFAFDLHKVILHRSKRSICWFFFKRLVIRSGFVKYLFNPVFWVRLLQARYQTCVTDDIFDRLLIHYPKLKKYRADFVSLENLQYPNQTVVALIKQLKTKGFKIYLLSNVGHTACTQLKTTMNSLFSLFDGLFYPQKEEGYLQKPNPAFYQAFLKKFDLDEAMIRQRILFIDDNFSNICAAAQLGFCSLHFKSHKQFELFIKNIV